MAASKTLTPEQRRERASKAARARTDLSYYVRAVVDRAPELTPDQVAKLRTIFAPGTARPGDDR